MTNDEHNNAENKHSSAMDRVIEWAEHQVGGLRDGHSVPGGTIEPPAVRHEVEEMEAVIAQAKRDAHAAEQRIPSAPVGRDFEGSDGGPLPGEPGNPNPSFKQMGGAGPLDEALIDRVLPPTEALHEDRDIAREELRNALRQRLPDGWQSIMQELVASIDRSRADEGRAVMSAKATQYHYLEISCAPESGDGIGRAGGAGFESGEAKRRFDNIPGCRAADFGAGQPTVVMDYLDAERNIVDTKFLLADTAATLIGIPVQDMYERAWADMNRRHRAVGGQ